MEFIRWGLLSTANINARLIPAIRKSKRGRLAAVASRSPHSAAAYARRWAIPHAFGSYQEMLESDAVDAVYISLPNHLHAEWSIRALAAGKHVLCEKPFALTTAQADAMIAAAERSGRVLAEAFMYRHHPQTLLAKQLIDTGRLGEVRHIYSTFGFVLTDPKNVRLVPEYGGGSLWDVGVYPVSLAQFLFGSPPERVSARQVIGETGVDVAFWGQMYYPGGRTAQFFSSFSTSFTMCAQINGSAGRLELPNPFIHQERARPVLYTANGRGRRLSVPRADQYLLEVEDLHTAILEGKPCRISLAESRQHIHTVQQLLQAAAG